MKRFICIISAVFCIAFASASDIFGFSWAVGSSANIYGDDAFVTRFKKYEERGCKNVVIFGEAGAKLKATENISFCANLYLGIDMLTNFSDFCLFLDYGISGGVRVYPGIGGLSVGMEYVTGMRADSVKGEPATVSAWGNGFRFLVEYEFKNIINTFSPSLGFSWRRMPRGNNAADHTLALYVRIPF